MSKEKLSLEEVAEILGDASFPEHRTEAQERWGATDDWATSSRKTATMTRVDWESVKQETARVEAALAHAMNRGVEPGSDEANELAEAHRALLSGFFPVTHAKHVLISNGYVSDPRFRQHYEARGKGLSAWIKATIDANAVANGIDPETAAW